MAVSNPHWNPQPKEEVKPETTVDLSGKSEVELKAMGYEQLVTQQVAQNNLSAINQELTNRQK